MKYQLMQTLKSHFLANIEKHKANIEVMLNNPQGIPEHTDWIESVEKEVEKLAHYDDLHSAFCKHIEKSEPTKTMLNETSEYQFEHDSTFYTNT